MITYKHVKTKVVFLEDYTFKCLLYDNYYNLTDTEILVKAGQMALVHEIIDDNGNAGVEFFFKDPKDSYGSPYAGEFFIEKKYLSPLEAYLKKKDMPPVMEFIG